MPPSFGDKDYWDARFAKNSSQFDWLLPADALDGPITQALASAPSNDEPHILHIGCGTSLLSFHLRDLVRSPSQIHNVDFSAIAIDTGKTYEATESRPERMRWTAADLLSLDDILTLRVPGAGEATGSYNIILDKSTADAISCAEDVPVHLPYALTTESERIQHSSSRTAPAHPLYLLTLHMAFLAPPGGRWIVLSYSNTRFSFLTSQKAEDQLISDSMIDTGFINPQLLWKVVGEEALDAPQVETGDKCAVGRPLVKHTLYTLLRTDVQVTLRPC
ncbi:hypothetical protein Dda_8293 [Drechslerella dactyloides]|uniref:Uncharacterized protein n=1 Tax=Drechslerella dactyloides TaxID=74499 RepID=A0AAD6ISY0_DREDA|nr:hypothetical protein Dda_8293 [Drechslerella dactyloides]